MSDFHWIFRWYIYLTFAYCIGVVLAFFISLALHLTVGWPR